MNHIGRTEFSHSAQKNYDNLSSFYDLLSGGTERTFIHKTIGLLNLIQGENYLDIGCGTGTGLIELARECPAAKNIIGVDISMGMCRKTVQKFNHQLCLAPKICQADAFSLPFHSNSFDLVFMSFTFELIPHHLYQPLCNEVLRVLTHDGIFSTVNIMESKSKNLIFTFYKWGHTHYPNLIDCRPINSPSILRSFGFKIVSSRAYSLWGIPVTAVTASKVMV